MSGSQMLPSGLRFLRREFLECHDGDSDPGLRVLQHFSRSFLTRLLPRGEMFRTSSVSVRNAGVLLMDGGVNDLKRPPFCAEALESFVYMRALTPGPAGSGP